MGVSAVAGESRIASLHSGNPLRAWKEDK